jgi:hypothetical protein
LLSLVQVAKPKKDDEIFSAFPFQFTLLHVYVLATCERETPQISLEEIRDIHKNSEPTEYDFYHHRMNAKNRFSRFVGRLQPLSTNTPKTRIALIISTSRDKSLSGKFQQSIKITRA